MHEELVLQRSEWLLYFAEGMASGLTITNVANPASQIIM